MSEKWQTMAEYARTEGISREAVRQAVLAGRLQSNGKTGRQCRVKGPLAQTVRIKTDSAEENPGKLADAKLAKLLTDVELQKQKLFINIQNSRRFFIQMIVEEYITAFAPLKVKLIELELSAKQLSVLGKIIENCTNDFSTRVEKKLIEYDNAT